MENSPFPSLPPYNHTQFNKENTLSPSLSLFPRLCWRVWVLSWIQGTAHTIAAMSHWPNMSSAIRCYRARVEIEFYFLMDFLFVCAAGDKWASPPPRPFSCVSWLKVLKRSASVQHSWLLAVRVICCIRQKAAFQPAFNFPFEQEEAVDLFATHWFDEVQNSGTQTHSHTHTSCYVLSLFQCLSSCPLVVHLTPSVLPPD